MIPEAWQNDTGMSASKKAYYRWNAYSMEPWDGPGLGSYVLKYIISSILQCLDEEHTVVLPVIMSHSDSMSSRFFIVQQAYSSSRRRVIRVGMLYDPIQGQGHGGRKSAKMVNFKVCFLCHCACDQRLMVKLFVFMLVSLQNFHLHLRCFFTQFYMVLI